MAMSAAATDDSFTRQQQMERTESAATVGESDEEAHQSEFEHAAMASIGNDVWPFLYLMPSMHAIL